MGNQTFPQGCAPQKSLTSLGQRPRLFHSWSQNQDLNLDSRTRVTKTNYKKEMQISEAFFPAGGSEELFNPIFERYIYFMECGSSVQELNTLGNTFYAA